MACEQNQACVIYNMQKHVWSVKCFDEHWIFFTAPSQNNKPGSVGTKLIVITHTVESNQDL